MQITNSICNPGNLKLYLKQGATGAAWHCERGLEDCQVDVIFFSRIAYKVLEYTSNGCSN